MENMNVWEWFLARFYCPLVGHHPWAVTGLDSKEEMRENGYGEVYRSHRFHRRYTMCSRHPAREWNQSSNFSSDLPNNPRREMRLDMSRIYEDS